MLKDNVVTKSNDLNLRAYKLSKNEQLVVLSVASMVQPQDEDFKTYRLSIKEFMDLLGVSDKSKYTEIPKITRGLMMKVIEIKNPHSLLQVAWFASVEHKIGEGVIEIEFSPKLKPYLLSLKDNFVTYSLNQVAKLSSKYSIRIYELLKQYQFKKVVTFDLNDFRDLIGLDSTTYPRYSNMKPKVLLVAKKELKEKTDLSFELEEIKKGKKITSLKFFIKQNVKNNKMLLDYSEVSATILSQEEDIENENDIKRVMRIMSDFNITSFEALKILKSANGNIDIINRVYKDAKAKKIDNIVGYMIAMVKPNAFNDCKKNMKQLKFTDYDQREYDFDDLEEKLLGWKK